MSIADKTMAAGLVTNTPAPVPRKAWTSFAAHASVDVWGLAGIVLLLALWWGLTWIVPPMSLPGPIAVIGRIGHDFFVAEQLSYYGLPETGLFGSMVYTARNVILAVTIGSALGTVLGLMTARVTLLRALLDPIFSTIGTIPILVMAPFFLIWFGTEGWSALLLVIIYVTVILYLYAQRAADNLDPVYEDNARMLGATTAAIVRDVLIPGTLPQILGGIRIALAGAWGLEAIAELLGSQQGIGKIIEVLSGSLDMEGIFACLLVLGVVALGVDFVVGRVVAAATRWRPAVIGRG